MAISAHDLQKKVSNGKGPLGPLGTPKKFSNISVDAASVERTRVDDESDVDRIYQIGEVLGKGAFGVVKEVTYRETGEKYAMKIVPKNKPGSVGVQLLEREVEVLKRVNHPSIIQVHAVYETAKKMYIVMELCQGGELSDELKKRTHFKEEDAKAVMRRVVEAVVYMHDNDMVHRDLKLENILLGTENPNDYSVKVTDFGLANMKGVAGCEDTLMHSKCGTPYYMAPEVLDTRHDYTKMCDVWSLGVIMYSLLCGKYPFYSSKPMKLEELIQEGKLTFSEIEWVNVSETAKDLLRNMLCVDTTSRYTARRILDDPWFTGRPNKMIDALAMMKDMVNSTASSATNIVVSSPSGIDNFPVLSSNLSVTTPSSSSVSSSTTLAYSTTNIGKPPSSSGTPSIASSTTSVHKRQTTPTKKTSAHSKPVTKVRTQSTSSIPHYSISHLGNRGGGGGGGGGNLYSSSAVTSPTHKQHSVSSSHLSSGPRPRGATYSTGAKSQVLSPTSGPSHPSKGSSYESLHSSSHGHREKKVTSPTRTSRTNTLT